MKVAQEDLRLDILYVITPKGQQIKLAENIHCCGLVEFFLEYDLKEQ